MPATATALSICRNVASIVGINPPATIRGNAGNDAAVLLALLNRSGQVLASKRGPFGEGWAELTREYIVETVAGQDSYALPEGFSNILTDSAWDRDTYREAPGPLTPQQYQRLQGGLIDTVALTPRWRIAFNPDSNTRQFRIDPVPADSGERIAFEYVSSFWLRDSVDAPISRDRIALDDQIPVFPAFLMELDLTWRMKNARGLDYRAEIAEFELERDRQFVQNIGPRNVTLFPQAEEDVFLGANVPESGFGGV